MTYETEPFGQWLSFSYSGDTVTTTDSSGGSTVSTDNPDGSLASSQLSVPGLSTLGVSIDEATGDVTRTSNGATVGATVYTYNSEGEITGISDLDASGNLIDGQAYTYNGDGQLASETDAPLATSGTSTALMTGAVVASTAAAVAGTTTTYGYDASGQLTSAGGTSYSYDANGNRTGTGIVTGPDNQILSDGTWNYSYDADGNRIGKTDPTTGLSWTYTYDDANRLTSATEFNALHEVVSETNLAYDVFGNLLQETVSTPSNAIQTVERYAYNGQQAWAELNANDQVTTRYLDGNTVDQVFARESANGSVGWYLTDRLGSVRDIVNNAGTILDHINYDANGNITFESNPSQGDSQGFAGMTYIASVGVYFDHARDYDPGTSTFTTQDPSGFDAGDPNLYRYVSNNATNATDPTGLSFLGMSMPSWEDYKHYLFNPQDMDGDLRVAQRVAIVVAVTAGSIATGGTVMMATAGSGTATVLAAGAATGAVTAGASNATIQAYDKGIANIDMNEVRISMAAGLAGGAAGAGVMGSASTLGRTVVTGFVGGSAGGAVSGGASAYIRDENVAVGALKGAAVNGAIGAGAGAVGFGMNKALQYRAPACSPNGCFAAGTPIVTEDGCKFIEEIKPGDSVLSAPEYDPEGVVALRRVEETFRNYLLLMGLRFGNIVIRTTIEHPFWVQGRGWIPANLVIEGDRLIGVDGSTVIVTGIERQLGMSTVYNMRVADYHTYFVGSPAWGFAVWTHNNECQTEILPGEGATPEVVTGQQQADAMARTAKRVDVIKANMTEGELGHTTFAVNEVVVDGQTKVMIAAAGRSKVPDGVQAAVRETLEPGQTLHPVSHPDPAGVSGVNGNHLNDAELHLLRAAQAQEVPILATGATRAMCHTCQDGYEAAGVIDTVVTPKLP